MMENNETPYLTYGLGYEEDERIIRMQPFFDDVLDLAKYLVEKYPNERISILHNMFQIGFNCGQRAGANVSLSDDELHQHAVKLTSSCNQIRIITRLLENVDYSKSSGDEFAVRYQIESGLLNDIGDNLSVLEAEIQNVSNDICPD